METVSIMTLMFIVIIVAVAIMVADDNKSNNRIEFKVSRENLESLLYSCLDKGIDRLEFSADGNNVTINDLKEENIKGIKADRVGYGECTKLVVNTNLEVIYNIISTVNSSEIEVSVEDSNCKTVINIIYSKREKINICVSKMVE